MSESPLKQARDRFVDEGKDRWTALEVALKPARIRDPEAWTDLAARYRDVTADLARARTLGLPEETLVYLDQLAGRAHNRLYGPSRGVGRSMFTDLIHGFPHAFRKEWRFMLAAHVVFYAPFLVGVVGPLIDPNFAILILPEAQLEQMEMMYQDAPLRTASQNISMAGFYVWNNIGIAFKCFANGALFGLGSIFTLVYNGIVLGTVEGHLHQAGLGPSLWDFTVGHSAWELTGIAVSGGAGMRMGWALVVTDGRTRIGALRAAAPQLYRLMLGAFALLFIAAMIEGYWSAGSQPFWLKLIFGAVGLAIIVGWLTVGGRHGEGRS